MPRLSSRQRRVRDMLKTFLDHHTTRLKSMLRRKKKSKCNFARAGLTPQESEELTLLASSMPSTTPAVDTLDSVDGRDGGLGRDRFWDRFWIDSAEFLLRSSNIDSGRFWIKADSRTILDPESTSESISESNENRSALTALTSPIPSSLSRHMLPNNAVISLSTGIQSRKMKLAVVILWAQEEWAKRECGGAKPRVRQPKHDQRIYAADKPAHAS
ncbi:hypothetical protein B0H17DRAFT_1133920 [Mycena rosella]|uniref:Uncharacterized protein n=1 Tax=Mycena rosella TaxID=1033263 RepID=A0AAD7DGG8_MYCRO|nr:hypothetical protein B0H17DRAFT_1133920 [Mycena rosella]